MKNEELCSLVQDLLPLYDDGEVSTSSWDMIHRHLESCPSCRRALDIYRQPLIEIKTKEAHFFKEEPATRFLLRLKKLSIIVLVLIILVSGGLAWASYRVGQTVTYNDPNFRRAIQERLFTPVHQTQKLGSYTLTVERILLDNTRTLVFYHLDPALSDQFLELTLEDNWGRTYEQRSSRGYHGRDYIIEMEPVDPAVEKLKLVFTAPGTPAQAFFEISVDPAAIQATARELWLNLSKDLEELRLDVDHVLLGISRTQVDIRAFWPLEDNVCGLGVGMELLPAPKMDSGVPRSAAGGFMSFGSKEAPVGEQGRLLDVTNRREFLLEGIEWQTDGTTGGIKARLNFPPIVGTTEELYLYLPPLYLYRSIPQPPEVVIGSGSTENMDLELSVGDLMLQLMSIVREEGKITVECRLPNRDRHPLHLPGLVLLTPEGLEIGGRLQTVNEEIIRVVFYTDIAVEGVTLKLKSVGKRLDGLQHFTIPVPASTDF